MYHGSRAIVTVRFGNTIPRRAALARLVTPWEDETVDWKNRIVENRRVRLEELHAHPLNWRLHGRAQHQALGQVLDQVGLVQEIVINRRSQEMGWPEGSMPVLVDGHLRLELAREHGESELPAVIVDLAEEEERLVLATLDPIGAMAQANAQRLVELLSNLPPQEGALADLLEAPLLDDLPPAVLAKPTRTFIFRLDDEKGAEVDAAFERARTEKQDDNAIFHALVTR
jgi:hypothetical protein